MGKGAETRQAILAEAIEAASTDGLSNLTIGELARTLGMSKSGLFAHFRSKEKLQIAVVEAAANRFIERVVTPAMERPCGEPRIRALFDHWLEWSETLRGGCVFVAAAVESDDQPGELRDYLESTQQEWMTTLSHAARVATEVGHFRSDLDPEQFAFEFQSMLLGYHHVHRLLRDPSAKARTKATFEALLIRARAPN